MVAWNEQGKGEHESARELRRLATRINSELTEHKNSAYVGGDVLRVLVDHGFDAIGENAVDWLSRELNTPPVERTVFDTLPFFAVATALNLPTPCEPTCDAEKRISPISEAHTIFFALSTISAAAFDTLFSALLSFPLRLSFPLALLSGRDNPGGLWKNRRGRTPLKKGVALC